MMKILKKEKLVMIGVILSMTSYAQLKVYSDGSTSVGSTAAPTISNFKLKVYGHSVFCNNINTITSSPMIRGTNSYSSATTPDFTFFNNDRLGIFHPAADVMAFTSNGVERMRINGTGKLFVGTTTDYGSWVNIYGGGDNVGLYCDVNHLTDWKQAVVSKVSRVLSTTYVVTRSGADYFYVRGDGLVCSASGFYTWSDVSLKENIKNIANPLDKVLKLRGVTYNYKEQKKSIGDWTYCTRGRKSCSGSG